jgi:hypothetical protein
MILAVTMLGIATTIALVTFLSNLSNAGIIRFPFVIAASFLALVIPQAAGLLVSDHYLAVGYRQDGTATVICYMILTCLAGGLAGHHYGLNRRTSTPMAAPPPRSVHAEYVSATIMATFLITTSVACTLLLASLGGGVQQFFFEGGSYDIEWTGLPVYLGLGVRLIYPALFFAFVANGVRSTWLTKLLIIVGIAYPLVQIVFLNRRSDIIWLTMAMLVSVYYYSRIRIPRPIVVAGVLLGILAIQFQAQFRSSQEAGLAKYAQGISIGDKIDEVLTFTMTSEIAAAAYTVRNVSETGQYQYGAMLWDAQVKQWVPGAIVGDSLKNSLRIFDRGRDSSNRFGVWDRGRFFYIAPFGISDGFQQFGYLGFLLFGAMGYLFGRWQAGVATSPIRVYLLAIYLPFAALAVGHNFTPGISRWPVDLAVLLLYGFLLRQVSRQENRVRQAHGALAAAR